MLQIKLHNNCYCIHISCILSVCVFGFYSITEVVFQFVHCVREARELIGFSDVNYTLLLCECARALVFLYEMYN